MLRNSNKTLLAMLMILLMLLLVSCKSRDSITASIPDISIINQNIKKAIALNPEKQEYFLEYTIRNSSKKEIYSTEGVVFFKNGKQIIQESEPILFYHSQRPLRPGYEFTGSKILTMPSFPWNGKKFTIGITKVANSLTESNPK